MKGPEGGGRFASTGATLHTQLVDANRLISHDILSGPVRSGSFHLAAVHAVLVVFGSLLQPQGPDDDLHDQTDAAQNAQHNDVGRCPLVLRLQQIEPFEDVDDDKDDGGVADGVVVDIPVLSVLRVRLGPQEQSKDLKRWKNEQYV